MPPLRHASPPITLAIADDIDAAAYAMARGLLMPSCS